MNEVHRGEVGKIFQILTEADLTDATAIIAKVRKPSGKVSAWIPTIYGDPTLGIVRYTSVAGDLDEPGMYGLQSYKEASGGRVTIGRAIKFKVLDDFEVGP